MIVLRPAMISSLGDIALMFEDIWMTCLVIICWCKNTQCIVNKNTQCKQKHTVHNSDRDATALVDHTITHLISLMISAQRCGQHVVNNVGANKVTMRMKDSRGRWKVVKLMRGVRIEDIIATICQSLDYTVCTHLLITLTSSKKTAVLNYHRFIEGMVVQICSNMKQTRGTITKGGSSKK